MGVLVKSPFSSHSVMTLHVVSPLYVYWTPELESTEVSQTFSGLLQFDPLPFPLGVLNTTLYTLAQAFGL